MSSVAVIFDFDGTVVDSEPNYYLADKKLLSQYDIEFTKEMKEEYIGIGSLNMVRQIKKRFNIQEKESVLLARKNDYYLQIAMEKTEVFPEMLDFIKRLKRENIRMGLATGCSRNILDPLLSKLKLDNYFDVVLTAEEVMRGKPEPDIFLETAKRLRIDAKCCVVVEDSEYGIEAGIRAKMNVIGIPYILRKPLPDIFSKCSLLFDSGQTSFNSIQAMNFIHKV